MPAPEARAERRSLASRRKRDHIVTPVRIASLAAPTLIMLVLLITHGQAINPDYVTMVTTTIGLSTALVVLRNNTMHLRAQDTQIGEVKVSVNGRLDSMVHLVLTELANKAIINTTATSAQGQNAGGLGAALDTIQSLSAPAPLSETQGTGPGSEGDIRSMLDASVRKSAVAKDTEGTKP